MPGPVFQGRCVVEIEVPKKTVCQNECERCGRTWYSEENVETAKVIVRMVEGGKPIVDASYDVLCSGCTQTVQNLVAALARNMKKLGPAKPRAKKEGPPSPSEPNGSSPTLLSADPAKTLPTARPTHSSGSPSRRQ